MSPVGLGLLAFAAAMLSPERVALAEGAKKRAVYRLPVASAAKPRVSSPYGMRRHPLLHRMMKHNGIDIAAPRSTPVFPARPGKVIAAGRRGGYGLVVVIRHRDGATTLYGHLLKIMVKVGEPVTRAKPIGRVGSTGRSTGPHLHFEVRDANGRPRKIKVGRRGS